MIRCIQGSNFNNPAFQAKFRFQRGTLSESMKTVMDVSSKKDLCEKINAYYASKCLGLIPPASPKTLTVEPYVYDSRINWNTHIVSIKDIGAIGFTDGPLK